MKKRLTDIQVKFISLVRKAANKKELIWKSSDETPVFNRDVKIVKSDEKRMVYGIVYSPNEVDAHGEFATAGDIEAAAMDFMKNLRNLNVDKEHSFQSEKAAIVESWIVKSEKDELTGASKGSWCVGIHIEDAGLWDDVKKGELTGISMAGYAVKKSEDDADTDGESRDAAGVLKKVKGMFEKLLKSVEGLKGSDGGSEWGGGELLKATESVVDRIDKKLKELGEGGAKGEEMKKLLQDATAQLERFEKAGVFSKRSAGVDEGSGASGVAGKDDYSIILKSDEEVIVPMRKAGPITPQSQRIGGALKSQASAKIIDFVMKQDLFSAVSTQRSQKLIRDIDVFSILRRVITRIPQGQSPELFVSSSNVGRQFVMKEVDLFGQIMFDAIWDNQDNANFENEKAQEFLTAISEDLKLLAWEGVNDDNSDGFATLNKGWLQLARDAGCAKLTVADYMSGDTVSWIELMSDMLKDLPTHFKSSLVKYFMNQSDYEQYVKQMGGLVSGSAQDIKTGSVETYMGYSIFHAGYIPSGKLMLVPAPNLAFGINTDVQRYREEKGAERCVNYTFVANVDYQIAVPDAIVYAE